METILEKSLTALPRRGRILLMEDALSVLVSQALGGRSIHEGAQLCGIADHLLRDIVLKKTRRPAPETLRAVSVGLDVDYERLALAAYGVIHNPVPA